MNVLIVDDDRFVVAALKNGIPWENLGFFRIYSAYNINEAKKIILAERVDLLLCDIDMPHGSGLDLLAWIRDTSSDMLVIFLTNYANFEYAQKALELHSFYYFLKPVEFDRLAEIIRSATRQLALRDIQTGAQCEHFWNAFLREEIPANGDSLSEHIRKLQLPYARTDHFLPVLFDIFPWYLSNENTLTNSLSQLSHPPDFFRMTFQAAFSDQIHAYDAFLEYNHDRSRFLAVFCVKNEEIPPTFSMSCETFIQMAVTQIPCDVKCFVGRPAPLSSFQSGFRQLLEMASDCPDFGNGVFLLSAYCPTADAFPEPDIKILEFYLDNAQYSAFLENCRRYLRRLAETNCLCQLSLSSFQVDISQLLYAFLGEKGIAANRLFQGSDYHFLSLNARYSLRYMEMYLKYLITVIQHHLNRSDQKKTLASSIREYVDQHYAEDIHRNVLSDVFYLDPNYGSKIFKKETGISFQDYIIRKRVEAAKELLRDTTLPINAVANQVGYDNYSYFSRLFKKMTRMTPVEYRELSDKERPDRY